MKIVKIIFFSLLAFSLVACMVLFIFFQTLDTDRYLPSITQKISIALGRDVSIGHLGIGFSLQGITLDAASVVIADDPDFTTQPFITINKVRIGLNSLLLESPQIHFIRSYEGRMNTGSIGQLIHPPRSNNSRRNNDSAGSKDIGNSLHTDVEKKIFPMINIKSIRIQDGSISFIDQNSRMPLNLWLNGIHASLNDFSMSKPFPLALAARFYNDKFNVHANARVSLDLPKRSVGLNDLKMFFNLSRLDKDRITDISFKLSDNSILANIAGKIRLNMSHLDIGAGKALEGEGDISITEGIIKNFNIIKVISSHLLGGLNIQWKDKLGANDTSIEKAQAKFSLKDKSLYIDDSVVQTDIFEFTAKGIINQELNTDLQTMLYLNEDISSSLVNQFGGLKFLCDDSRRVAIGASLIGTIPHLKYKPNKDFKKKSRKVLVQEGGNILGALLGGVQTSPQDQGVSLENQDEKLKKSVKNIFKSFLK